MPARPPARATPPRADGPQPLTVTALTRWIEAVLSSHLPDRLVVIGQLSNAKAHASGHFYFTLKDDESAISGVMWRTSFARVKFQPRDGLEVLATGRIGVYGPQGRYQLYIEHLEPRGVGALELAFRQLCEKLRGEGLFEPDRKRPLPAVPRTVGLVTSRSGAAVRDMVRALHRRNSAVRIVLWPVAVQGEGAAAEIAAAIRGFGALPATAPYRPEVLIVGRGGGSLEDLWAFNEEVVARAVADSPIPVISAVGHETDTTVCCLVADVRAATPTAGAELAAPPRADLLADLDTLALRLSRQVRRNLERAEQDLRRIGAAAFWRQPARLLDGPRQRLDQAITGLAAAMSARLHAPRTALHGLAVRLARVSPQARLAEWRVRLSAAADRLRRAAALGLERGDHHLRLAEQRLAAVDPRSVLARGYSITRKVTGEVVEAPDEVCQGEAITTELAGGTIHSRVGEDERSPALAPLVGPVPRPVRRRGRSDAPGQMQMFD